MIAKALGREAYELSNAGKLFLDAQKEAPKKAKEDFRKLKKSDFAHAYERSSCRVWLSIR
ncbi:hypothetical protein Wenmar_01789 [Wenxinia marina DSM 24838]|uniref:Uncharacterized protein n=2 Tax=Wenxinia TaxID=653686 RepID=A0A0D0QAU6_9RHOB|nr:hypothetical protein Wenmar_01789 [Wenxinia marina DSM 24838]